MNWILDEFNSNNDEQVQKEKKRNKDRYLTANFHQ